MELFTWKGNAEISKVGGVGWSLRILSHFTGLVNKAFGSLCHEQYMRTYRQDYTTNTLADSIRKTEMK